MNLDKISQLQNITDKIINNMTSLRDSLSTADLDAQINQTNQLLNQQLNLSRQIQSIDTTLNQQSVQNLQQSLQVQNNIANQLGLPQIQKTFRGAANQQRQSNQIITGLGNTNLVPLSGPYWTASSGGISGSMGSMRTMGYTSSPSNGGFDRTNKYGLIDAAGFLAMKEGLVLGAKAGSGLTDLGSILQSVPMVSVAGTAIKKIGDTITTIIDAIKKAFEVIDEIVSVANKFGDKLEEMVSVNDEAIKSTIQGMGLISDHLYGDRRKSDEIAKNLLLTSKFLVQEVGIPFGPENIAELQKAYSNLSKTSLAFHTEDYIEMAEIQKTLDLASQDMAEFSSAFIDMGGTIEDMGNAFVALMDSATKSGVQAQSIIKGFKNVYKSSEIFRFGGSLTDMTDMMAYAKRIKVDIEGMFKLMDKVSDPTAAVNLAAQLQALDTVFLGLDPIDLMGAAMTDVDRFTEMITGPLRDNVDKYFDLASGQLTQYGKLFSKSFLQIDGINNIFKSGQEFADFLAKASKEGEVRELLMNSAESFASLAQFTPKEQDQLIGILASQYQAGGIVTGLGRKNIGNLTEADMKQLLASGFAPGTDSKQQIEKAAQGAVSVKDQAEVNKKLVDSMSYATDAINEVTTVLSSKEMRSVYSLAGNVIMDAGLKTFESDFFRKFKVFREYMGISTEMGLLYQGYVDLSIEKGENFLAQAMKSFQEKLYLVDPTTWISPTGNGVIFNKNLFKKDTQSKGGIIGVQKLSIPSKSITSTPKSMGSPNSELLSKVLMSFITNKFGPGIVSNMGGGTTKIIVSGEINNMINGKDESVISGDKVLKILEKQLA